MNEPVLTKRIPTAPYGDPKDRHVVHYDEFVQTGGYEALRKSIGMERADVVSLVKDCILRGRGGAGGRGDGGAGGVDGGAARARRAAGSAEGGDGDGEWSARGVSEYR